jgi:hypothetical protein
MSKWRIGVGGKEDSTRGKAMMRPKNFKGDALIQVWYERRKIASLDKWLEDNGRRNRFMSDVLRSILDMVYEKLLEDGKVIEFEVQHASDYLQSKFRIDLNPGDKGKRNLLHNMQLEEIRKESELGYREFKSQTIETAEDKYGTSEKPLKEDIELAKKIARVVESRSQDFSNMVDNSPAFDCRVVNKDLPWVRPDGSKDMKIYVEYVKKKKAEYEESVKAERIKNEIEEKERKKRIKQEIRDSNEIERLLAKKRLREALEDAKLKVKLDAIKRSRGGSIDRNVEDDDGGQECIDSNSNSNMLRAKTDEEINADYERIKEKDRMLMESDWCVQKKLDD